MSLQNRIEFFLFIIFVKFFNIIGLRSARRFSVLLAFLFCYIIPVRKNVVIKNLSIAFPHLTDAEIKKLTFRAYRSICVTLVEIFLIPAMSKEELKNMMDIPLIDEVRRIYNEKRGGILLTAHFGNWEMGAASIGNQLGIPIHVIAKRQRNDFVTDWLNSMRESAGNKVVMLGVSIKNIFKELLNRNIIAIVGDQRGPSEGLRVDFFNRKTAVYNGAALLSVKTNAPIFFSSINRQPDYRYKVYMEIVYPGDFSGTEDEKVLQITQKYMTFLECSIKLYPEQWFWMHNIWKY